MSSPMVQHVDTIAAQLTLAYYADGTSGDVDAIFAKWLQFRLKVATLVHEEESELQATRSASVQADGSLLNREPW